MDSEEEQVIKVLKEIWDFVKSVTSDTIAPWVNRALPHMVSPTVKMARAHSPKVRRWTAVQVREILVSVREMPQILRNPWLWPLFLALTVGVGMEATRWAATVEVAGGAVVSVYACAALYFIIRGGVQRVVNRSR